jgi:DNA replication protein DnaC
MKQGEQSYNNDVKNTYQAQSQHQITPIVDISTPQAVEIPGKISDTNIVDLIKEPGSKIAGQIKALEEKLETSPMPSSNPIALQETAPQITATIPAIKPMTELPLGNTTVFDRKIKDWKKELLDLTKRNKMINYRETKRTTLKILEPEFTELFNRLAIKEEELTFQRPMDKNFKPKISKMISLLETLAYPIPIQFGDIKTDRSSLDDRRITLGNLHAKSKLARDEQGTNILYLSFGFIEWKDDDVSLKSPLLIMPVSLKQKSIQDPFILVRYDDDIEVNPTIAHLFKERYNIDLPAFELENEKSIELYIQKIEILANKNSWKLTREVSLGLLSFLKIGMYYDIENNRNRMLQNPVIRAMTGDSDARDAVNNIPNELNNFAYDDLHPRDCYQVVSSDSSQQEAIMLSKAGVSFVMQGPPGTGKSQTITNIIAEALADGKKILFVSEKAAALQVVYKRLEETEIKDLRKMVVFWFVKITNFRNLKHGPEQLAVELGRNSIQQVQVPEQIEPQVADSFALLKSLLKPWKNGKSNVYILIVSSGMLPEFDKPDVLNYVASPDSRLRLVVEEAQ